MSERISQSRSVWKHNLNAPAWHQLRSSQKIFLLDSNFSSVAVSGCLSTDAGGDRVESRTQSPPAMDIPGSLGSKPKLETIKIRENTMKTLLRQSRYPADPVVPENGTARENGARPQENSLYQHLNRERAHLISSKREALKIFEKVDVLDELKRAGVDTRRMKVLMASADERGKQSLQRLRGSFRRPKGSVLAQYFANRARASLLPPSIVALSP